MRDELPPSDPGDPLIPLIAGIRQHPEFDDAACCYLESLLDLRRQFGLFNRVGTNLGMHVAQYVIYLHFAHQQGEVAHGATFSQVLDICLAREQCGSRALRTTLILMRTMGQLTAGQSATDKRVQVYVPTEKLLSRVRERYAYVLAVLDRVCPGATYADTIESDPDFLAQIIANSGRAMIEEGVELTEVFPDLRDVVMQAGGIPTCLAIAVAQMKHRAWPTHRGIANEFKISPTQIRAVVARAVERGLVSVSRDRKIVNAHVLVEQYKGLIARELALHLKHGLGRNLDGLFGC